MSAATSTPGLTISGRDGCTARAGGLPLVVKLHRDAIQDRDMDVGAVRVFPDPTEVCLPYAEACEDDRAGDDHAEGAVIGDLADRADGGGTATDGC